MKKITWIATKIPSKPIKVSFYTKKGVRVELKNVIKKFKKPNKVEFYTK